MNYELRVTNYELGTGCFALMVFSSPFLVILLF